MTIFAYWLIFFRAEIENFRIGQIQYPDQIEFYKKVVVSSSSQGYRAVRMSKEISAIRQSYIANTDYSAHVSNLW